MAVFAESGLDAEIKEIAERAGLAVGTVYRHFPGKDELIAAIIEQAMCEFDQTLERVEHYDDAAAAVRTLIDEGLARDVRYGKLMTAVMEGRVSGAAKLLNLESRRLAIQERLSALIASGIRSGAFRPEIDCDIAIAMLKSVLMPRIVDDLRRDHTPQEIADGFMSLFLHGAAG